MTPTPLLTREEVADTLRVSLSTVSRWTRSGVLTPVRIEGTTRFRREDVEALIASGVVAGEAS